MRSTKQKDRKKAVQVAEKWEAAAQKARRGELTQAASVKILRDMMEVTTGDELRAPSIAETVNGYCMCEIHQDGLAGWPSRRD